MKKLIALALLAFGFGLFAFGLLGSLPASAQIYGTYAFCNGVWYPGSCPSQFIGPQQQQVMMQPQMQAMTLANALGSGFSKCETVGGIAGATLGSLFKNHREQAMILGAIGGGMVANGYCSNPQSGQQVILVQQVPQQFGQQPQQVQPRAYPCAHDPGTKRGILNLPGHKMHGQTVCAPPGDVNISKWLE